MYTSGPIDALVFGGIGAPTGMLTITGIGLKLALLNVASNFPTLSGPSTVTPFFTNVMAEDGCDQSDPWNVCELFVKLIAVVFTARGAIVNIDLLPLAPCQAL